MPKPTAAEAATGALAVLWAAFIGVDLADHDVSAFVIVSVILALLSTGLTLGTRFRQAMRTQLFTCPEPGCSVEIRATNQPDECIARLRELATDHAGHPATRS